MKLILIGAVDPTTAGKIGGTRTYIINLLSSLGKSGMDMTLIGISYNKFQESTEVNFIPLKVSTKISGFDFFLNLILKVRFIAIPKDAVIHVQSPQNLLPFILFYPRNPKILTMHGIKSKKEIIDKHGKLMGNLFCLLINIGIKHSDRIIAVDEKSKKELITKNSVPDHRIRVIPPGIDITLFKPLDKSALRKKYGFDEHDKIILYVGRFDRIKGLDLLILAFKLMQQEIKDSKLVLVGDGPEEKYLKDLTKNQTNVLFLEKMDHSLIPEIMNCADVFVLCSLREGMPTVVLEAMACGVPVVSTDVGDVGKVVKNDFTGYIILSRKEKEVSDKLKTILKSPNGFSQNCINVAKEYSNEKVGESILKVYNEVLEKK